MIPLAGRQRANQGFLSTDLAVVTHLGDEALKHPNAILNTQRDLETTQAEEGTLGQVLRSLNVTVGAGVGASDPFEQANLRGSVLNLSSLTAPYSSGTRGDPCLFGTETRA